MDDTPTRLLVAERDDELREFLVDQFLADRFATHGAQSAEEARIKLADLHPRVLVLGSSSSSTRARPAPRHPVWRRRRAAGDRRQLGRLGARRAARL